jgi:tetratricopeptide (TPR) repeat protein
MNYEHWRHYARGWLFHFFGREDAAFEAYLTAFRNNPQDVQSARHLAAIAAKRKNWEVAIKWFEAALALTPDDGANWFNLGYVCEHAGKPKEAIAAFTEAVRLVPAQDMAWYGMGLAHSPPRTARPGGDGAGKGGRTATDERRGFLPAGHGLSPCQPSG